jgi:molybdenum cofactor synthesis domain-containing protein
MMKVAILTVSDRGSRGERKDTSGPAIEKMMKRMDAEVISCDILPDEKEGIRKKLIALCRKADLVLTTGGTGVSPRDVTPEATREVIQQEIPGMAEAMRIHSMKKTPYGMLSRAVAGVRNRTLIVNLPGSPKAVRENLGAILPCLPHAVAKIQGDMSECDNDNKPLKNRLKGKGVMK